jgi:quaternary ammonium compound-resistance protein SugE
MQSAWLVLVAGGLCEIAWAVGLKYTAGWTRWLPSAVTLFFMVASVLLLERASRSLPVGTAYAVWTGIGAVGTALAGIYLFNEAKDGLRLLCIGLIVAGILGLKLLD